jgi:hypothetical protein
MAGTRNPMPARVVTESGFERTLRNTNRPGRAADQQPSPLLFHLESPQSSHLFSGPAAQVEHPAFADRFRLESNPNFRYLSDPPRLEYTLRDGHQQENGNRALSQPMGSLGIGRARGAPPPEPQNRAHPARTQRPARWRIPDGIEKHTRSQPALPQQAEPQTALRRLDQNHRTQE